MNINDDHGKAVVSISLLLSRFSHLDREYETLPTANHYMNANQCSSQTNSAIHYVTILS